MKTIRKSVSIQAAPSEIFEFMTHPENLLLIWPSMIEVTNVKRKPDGTHSFDWVYKMAGVKFHGHADSIEIELNKRSVVKNTGIPSTFRWLFAGEDGGTRVTMEVDYTIPVSLLDKLLEPFVHRLNEHEADTVLANLKARMEIGISKTVKPQPTARH